MWLFSCPSLSSPEGWQPMYPTIAFFFDFVSIMKLQNVQEQKQLNGSCPIKNIGALKEENSLIVQQMDINEGGLIQCMNCHQDMFEVRGKEDNEGTCEECLHAESNQVTVLQGQNEALSKELVAMETAFVQQIKHYDPFQDHDKSLRELELQLTELQLEGLHLSDEDDKVMKVLDAKREQFCRNELQLYKQSEALAQKQVNLYLLMAQRKKSQDDLLQLEQRKMELERMPLLSELYSIHFDDRAAYVNREPVNHKNCRILLEILCHLMEIYGYKGLKGQFLIKYDQGKSSPSARQRQS